MFDLEFMAGRYKITLDESWNFDRTLNPEDKLWEEVEI